MNSVLCVNAARMEKINTLVPGEIVSIFNLHDYKIRNFNINIMLYIPINPAFVDKSEGCLLKIMCFSYNIIDDSYKTI